MSTEQTMTGQQSQVGEYALPEALTCQFTLLEQLIQSCRNGQGHIKNSDGDRAIYQLVDVDSKICFALCDLGLLDHPDQPRLDYKELRSFRISLGTILAGEVRANPDGFSLAEADGPYQELLRLVRESNQGFGFHRFDLRDCGVTAEEERRWDSNECAYSDMAFWSDNSYDDFDD